ncbi:Phosphopantothenate-cysteine ligase /Phosphopantothenoylcysteine decarboxylase [Pelagirhabdus alkalitolerans]|uniref:Coenzyme A biosynthesis bifunctional protein CoaBC n=1 Tax=Pelagirhabdus alkalitolerans TaxID=1612202 RepID=A0A1G6H1L8_9BACI|nr:bifunctional phosphopantothenoylcysteine decarboxylase/phosphopantothenate--cysteine ligase CoaBC [Pelagirhabdus alkalitolerans]SDB88038.1 Phosphopantothenate-cysteine ligase /Phosphopantothenoylcysteine decarboxylase [Pelagirhabdus alkalitolerans]
MFQGKRIILAVTGGIAAYKAIALTSKLTQSGAIVKVILTKNAQQFVNALSFQAISRQPVYDDTFDEFDPTKVQHIDLADWADLFVVAPATANAIGKFANGIADDLLSTVYLATTAPVFIAPAMNVHMYDHPAVTENMETLRRRGVHFLEPGEGYLACGYVGKGRMAEPEDIVQSLLRYTQQKKTLLGKRVLISAGPTKERIDPVRFMSNHSSGKMGYQLAEVAQQLGAEVTLVSGPVNLASPVGVKLIQIETADEMYQAMVESFDQQDIVIKAAAVADYRPVKQHDKKLKKQDGDLAIEMERTQDILKALGEKKTNQYLVGFAAESDNHMNYGEKKLKEKNLDAIVINDISNPSIGFQSDQNEVTFMTNDQHDFFKSASKNTIATQIFNRIIEEIGVD